MLAGCGGDTSVPASYEFESRFVSGESSVDHAGQSARHVLMEDLESYVGSLTLQIDSDTVAPVQGEIVAQLDYFFSTDAANRAEDPIRLTTDPPTLQTTYGELSMTAILLEKLAGNDTSTDFRDWSTAFVGWSDPAIAEHGGGIDSPTNLVRACFETLEENAILRALGTSRTGPTGEELPVEVTQSGLHLGELIEEFLLGAIAFHQAADDYLDDDLAGSGLLSDNVADEGGHTELEHAWDEGFGYFGASAHYGELTAAEIAAGTTERDHDGDGRIDLFSERNFGAAVSAAKRDFGSAEAARTDFMGQAFLAFRTGRAIITNAGGPLTDAQLADLRVQRDLALEAWEATIAATVVHTINEVLQVMADFDTVSYDHDRFLTHAEEWSELKAFSLTFQFNPRSPLSQADFAMLHQLIGDGPVLPADGTPAADAYRASLRQARALLGAAYGFDAQNLGDDNGLGGW